MMASLQSSGTSSCIHARLHIHSVHSTTTSLPYFRTSAVMLSMPGTFPTFYFVLDYPLKHYSDFVVCHFLWITTKAICTAFSLCHFLPFFPDDHHSVLCLTTPATSQFTFPGPAMPNHLTHSDYPHYHQHNHWPYFLNFMKARTRKGRKRASQGHESWVMRTVSHRPLVVSLPRQRSRPPTSARSGKSSLTISTALASLSMSTNLRESTGSGQN